MARRSRRRIVQGSRRRVVEQPAKLFGSAPPSPEMRCARRRALFRPLPTYAACDHRHQQQPDRPGDPRVREPATL